MNQAVGETVARVCTLDAHPLSYREDMVVARGTHRELFEAAASADWLISTGDGDYKVFEMLRRFLPLRKDARFATCHVGSAYRQAHAEYDRADREMGFHARFIGGDLYRFAKDDPRAVPYFAPPDKITGWLTDVPRTISHSPTNRITKGTDIIKAVLGGFTERASVDIIEGVSYEECVKRRGRTAIFIDQINPAFAGFGASAVEAMAQGCAVLCNTANVIPEVWGFYPKPPIIEARTADELREHLRELLDDSLLLQKHRRASLAWINTVASPRPLADYWFGQLKRLAELPPPAEHVRVMAALAAVSDSPDRSAIGIHMMVRDDAAGLERALLSCRDQADEIVIGVDGRSDDATWDVAQRFATEFGYERSIIYRFDAADLGMTDAAWAANEIDFAAARNFNLSKMKSAWAFIIDSDEVLAPGADLRALVRDAGDVRGFVVTVDLEGTAHVSTRLARRDSFIYERATHNHMALIGARKEVLDIVISQDTGIRSEERQCNRDEQRDRAVLKMRTEAEKGEMGALFHLAKHHLTEDRIEEAEKLATDYRLRALPRSELADERFWLAIGVATIYYNKSELVKAEMWAIRSLFDGPRAEALCLLGDIAEEREDLSEAHAWYEAACALPELRPSKFNLRVITDFRRGRLAGIREALGLPVPT